MASDRRYRAVFERGRYEHWFIRADGQMRLVFPHRAGHIEDLRCERQVDGEWVTLAWIRPVFPIALEWTPGPLAWQTIPPDADTLSFDEESGQIKLHTAGVPQAWPWKVTDLYSFRGQSIRVFRRWEHYGPLASEITLRAGFHVPWGHDPRIVLPGIIYNDNPHAPAELPHLPLQPGAVGLYEEHRFPTPCVSLETTLADRRWNLALISRPSRLRYGVHEDQWWSLGGWGDEEGFEFALLSGRVASNGQWDRVYGHPLGWDSYPEAYLVVPPEASLEKIFYIQLAEVPRPGYGFTAPLWFFYRLATPAARPVLSPEKFLEAKLHYARSLWREEGPAAGFHCGVSPQFRYGRTGQGLRLATLFLTEGCRRNEGEMQRQAFAATDFFVRHAYDPESRLLRCTYDLETGTWSDFTERDYGEVLASLAEGIAVTERQGFFNDEWLDFLRARGDDVDRTYGPDWEPDYTAPAYLIAPLARLFAFTGEERYLEAAQRLAQKFYRAHTATLAEPYWGSNPEARCEDREAGAGFFQGTLALWRVTGEDQYLNWATRAAEWLLTFVYLWETGFRRGSECYGRLHTTGWTLASVQSHHLDAWGGFLARDIYDLGLAVGDDRWTHIARMLAEALTQGVATPQDPWNDAIEGDQAEQFFHTNYYEGPFSPTAWRGGINRRNPSWICAAGLMAAQFLQDTQEEP